MSVWIPRRGARVSVWALGYLCESLKKERNERGELKFACLVISGISVWILRRGARVSVRALGYLYESQKKERKEGEELEFVWPVISGISVKIAKRGEALSCGSWCIYVSPCVNSSDLCWSKEDFLKMGVFVNPLNCSGVSMLFLVNRNPAGVYVNVMR